MKTENHVAFKEWASIVHALGMGKQILILRKGGIREEDGEFKVDHEEFYLFPTYEHQNKSDLKPEAYEDLEFALKTKSPAEIPVRYYAQVVGITHVADEGTLERFSSYHVWSEKAVHERFHFGREKGLYVMAVRVFELSKPHSIPSDPQYGGCKSWVELKQTLSTQSVRSILPNREFDFRWREISSLFLQSKQV